MVISSEEDDPVRHPISQHLLGRVDINLRKHEDVSKVKDFIGSPSDIPNRNDDEDREAGEGDDATLFESVDDLLFGTMLMLLRKAYYSVELTRWLAVHVFRSVAGEYK